MAVKLATARQTFLKAVKQFPRWLSMRKRPEKAISGLFLQSIIDEHTDIIEELNKFIKEFFMIYYIGKESMIADYVYVTQVGTVDISVSEVTKPEGLTLTADGKTFLDAMNTYCLYQEGYFIVSEDNLPEDKTLIYTYNGYRYGGKLERYHIWNIFDEFAMFLGLSRFVDVQETNEELLKRCWLVFAYPANATRQGLINAIVNCMTNDITLEREDDLIKIEVPSEENMWLEDSQNGEIYEHLIQFNRDIYRSKMWDLSTWENNYKQLDYLAHRWDKEIDVFQDGVGHMNDLKVSLSQDEPDTTAVTVRGFKKTEETINAYFHKNTVQQNIPLTFTKYSDVLKPKTIQYKITATAALQIDPTKIYIKEENYSEGTSIHWLEDIVTRTNSLTVINPGSIDKDKTYQLIFKSDGDYSDMCINKVDLVEGSSSRSLLPIAADVPKNALFQYSGATFKNADVKRYIDKVSKTSSYENMIDCVGGFTLKPKRTQYSKNNSGSFTVDVTGCGNEIVKVVSSGEMFDITSQDIWELDGLYIDDDTKTLYSNDNIAAGQTAIVEMEGCMGFSFTVAETENQGTVAVTVWLNGSTQANSQLSQDITSPTTVTKMFDKWTKVKIKFEKVGEYPILITDIKATRYKIDCSLSEGTLIQGPFSTYISGVPDATPNTLTVTVESYDVVDPIIKCVHIGPPTTNATYTISDISTLVEDAYLDISTNCLVELWEIDGAAKHKVKDNFVTKKVYKNNTSEREGLEIDVSSFVTRTYESKKIQITTRAGITTYFIWLEPGEELSSLTITGTTYQHIRTSPIRSFLGMEDQYLVYIAKNAKGFIIRNPEAGEEWYTYITKDQMTEANSFTFTNLPSGVTGFFYVNEAQEVLTIANTTDRNWEKAYLSIEDDQEYIAYNKQRMYKEDLDDVNLVNTFTPIPEENLLLFYNLSAIESDDQVEATVSFKRKRYTKINYYGQPSSCRARLISLMQYMINGGKTEEELAAEFNSIKNIYNLGLSWDDIDILNKMQDMLTGGTWSLGVKQLFITSTFDFGNSSSYNLTATTGTQTITVSNQIELPRRMTVDGTSIDLCEYIITVPDNMELIYSDELEEVQEVDLYVEKDGFNKLHYSNVESVSLLTVNTQTYATNYTLLKQEGIIVWNDLQELYKTGNEVLKLEVQYKYRVPVALRYRSLDDLYDIASYNIDAYKEVEITKDSIPKTLSDGDSFVVEFDEPVDYVPRPSCSNSNFLASYNDGTVTVKRIYTDNVAIVQAGYYYDKEKEYYFYNHDKIDVINKYANVVFHNVKQYELLFRFIMATSNYLLHSDFVPNEQNYDKLCYVDFDDPRVQTEGISKLNMISACDTYNMWQDYNMNIELVEGLNGFGLKFIPTADTAYALLNITDYIGPNYMLSLFATDVKVSLYKEIKIGGDSSVKSTFVEFYTDLEQDINFYHYLFPNDIDMTYRYYLLVTGEGVIDDVVSRKDMIEDSHLMLHIKNIDRLGFVVSEREMAGAQHRCYFDRDGCNLNGLEIAKDNTIYIGANVDYGVTKIFELADHYNEFTTSETVVKRKGSFFTEDKKGTIKSPLFYVENHLSVKDAYIKINDVIIDNTENFNVRVWVKQDANDALREVEFKQKTNLCDLVGSQVDTWMQFEVEMDPSKVISNVEVIIRYAELGYKPLSIDDNQSGSIVTKVYNVVESGSYRMHHLIGKVEALQAMEFYMRGCRQDERHMVWTQWYKIDLNGDLEAVNNPHVFDDYQLLQFRMDFKNKTVSAKIDSFVLEVL